ncbi:MULTISPECIES: secondary thiamine-phosphate synthase enzyme YjbQ [Chelatococcus]|uniref:Secondary thiamine-phosphate synthase enzyme n=1 Tax=Chelatococcus caeni TaxID=1348468 RepID=A0A840BZX3_9HYPH|nr:MULTISPECIES: secondary thiamine-phosphate synthase enzyme YjbQ [Chelatococcus]ALA17011.1 secondary thiamine-phosphate synthase enzyme [Chelatococcus sp. CO-6]MBB4017272.1 secondary thiamine-phosphate synthase enzyme [Chelatococcus caeni]
MTQRDAIETTPLGAGPVTRQASARLVVRTRGPGFTDITHAVRRWLATSGIADGLLTVFCRHTSASLTIQENADPDVRADLATALDHLAPRNRTYVHAIEGPDDMPAHIRTMLTDASLAVPVVSGRLALGTWQGIYLIEHRDRPHAREVLVTAIGAAQDDASA